MNTSLPDDPEGHYTLDLNSFIVLESLSEDNKSEQTGQQLYNDIIKYADLKIPEYKGMNHFFKFHSKKEFIEKISQIIQLVQKGYRPMIHIECHGEEYGKGLIISPTDELITWEEIENQLRMINIMMKNSLFLTMAVCKGANIQNIVNVEKPAPFFSLVASTENVLPKQIYESYFEYYKTLIFDKDILKALSVVKAKGVFKIWGSQFDYRVFEDILINSLEKAEVDKIVNAKLKELQKSRNFKLPKKARNSLRKEMQDNWKDSVKKKIIEKRKVFLMLDKYPELANRYRELQLD